jgi:hypothetical protein
MYNSNTVVENNDEYENYLEANKTKEMPMLDRIILGPIK